MHQVSLETTCPLKAFQLHYCPGNNAKSMVKHFIFLHKFSVLYTANLLVKMSKIVGDRQCVGIGLALGLPWLLWLLRLASRGLSARSALAPAALMMLINQDYLK